APGPGPRGPAGRGGWWTWSAPRGQGWAGWRHPGRFRYAKRLGLSRRGGAGMSGLLGARWGGRRGPAFGTTGGDGDVGCWTWCFGRSSREDALRVIRDLRFNKFDAAIHEQGHQLRPSEVAADVAAAAARLRYGPGLAPAAFSVEFAAAEEAEFASQFKAV